MSLRNNNRQDKRFLLHEAAYNGDLGFVKHMLQPSSVVGVVVYAVNAVRNMLQGRGVGVDEQDWYGRTPLHWAAMRARGTCGEIVIWLLDNCSPDLSIRDNQGWTPLHLAAMHGDADTAVLLLTRGAVVDERGVDERTSLHLAAMYGYASTAESLLERGADVDERDVNGRTPLHWAAKYRNASTAESLLKRGADVDKRDVDERTPLHLAAMYGDASIAESLLTCGAVVDKRDVDGRTPLHLAVKHGRANTVRSLFGYGAVVDRRGASAGIEDMNRDTPLHWAASLGHVEIVRLLLLDDSGAKVNIKDKRGWTSLHFAVMHGYVEIVRLLLDHGANPRLCDSSGQSPAAMAKGYGHNELAALLRVAAQTVPSLELLCAREVIASEVPYKEEAGLPKAFEAFIDGQSQGQQEDPQQTGEPNAESQYVAVAGPAPCALL